MLSDTQQDELYEHAACKGTPTEYFYPSAENRISQLRAIHLVNTFCSACPVRSLCREAASDDPYGVWGGTFGSSRL